MELGTVVVNFGVKAVVVGFFKAAAGTSDVDGWPMLEAVNDDGKTGGGKWMADPKLCAVVSKPAAKPAKKRAAGIRLECNECGKRFTVSANAADPDCPKCGGVDWDVLDV